MRSVEKGYRPHTRGQIYIKKRLKAESRRRFEHLETVPFQWKGLDTLWA